MKLPHRAWTGSNPLTYSLAFLCPSSVAGTPAQAIGRSQQKPPDLRLFLLLLNIPLKYGTCASLPFLPHSSLTPLPHFLLLLILQPL